MGAAKARAMKAGGGAFDVDDFVAKLLSYMGGGAGAVDGSQDAAPLDWEKIGRKAMAKSRRVPAMDFMCTHYTLRIERSTDFILRAIGSGRYKWNKRSAL